MRGGVQTGAPSPCLWCRKPTRSPSRVCGEVCRTTARLADRVPSDDHALTDGAWVLDTTTRVLRWEPTKAAPPPPKPIRELIACPTCHARVDETCRTATGHTTTPHQSRLAPRLCPCGAKLAVQRRLCDVCRDETTRATKREWVARRRAERENVAC